MLCGEAANTNIIHDQDSNQQSITLEDSTLSITTLMQLNK